MKRIFLIFFGLLFSSISFAQQSDTTLTTAQDSTSTQDTVVVLSAEDMQAAEKLYNEGVAFYTKEKYAQALSKFNKAIEIKANFPKAYYNLALCHIALENLDSAMEDLNNVKEILIALRKDRTKRLILSCVVTGLLRLRGRVHEGDFFIYTLSYENFSELFPFVHPLLLGELKKLGYREVELELERINTFFLRKTTTKCLIL